MDAEYILLIEWGYGTQQLHLTACDASVNICQVTNRLNRCEVAQIVSVCARDPSVSVPCVSESEVLQCNRLSSPSLFASLLLFAVAHCGASIPITPLLPLGWSCWFLFFGWLHSPTTSFSSLLLSPSSSSVLFFYFISLKHLFPFISFLLHFH